MQAAWVQHSFVEKKTMTTPFHFNYHNWLEKLIPITLSICFICSNSNAQRYENLNQLKGHQTQVYFSAGADAKAKRIAAQLDKVIGFFAKEIHFTPSVTLLILSPQDWNNYSRSVVYGMPHYTNSKTLIVASENNDFWKSFIPPTDKMPKEYAQLIADAYSDKNNNLTMEPFFDLLAIHELGHAYHQQDSLTMQRKWMGELFANVFLHNYIAEQEPNLLKALTTFPKMVVTNTNKSTLKYTTLKDLETHYDKIAQKYPQNYGWYQCRWHIESGSIYDKGGLATFKKLWYALKKQKGILDDQSFATLLSENVHQSVADVQLKWEESK